MKICAQLETFVRDRNALPFLPKAQPLAARIQDQNMNLDFDPVRPHFRHSASKMLRDA
jgi:hypothetical protein